jgi:hypothetical protein
VQNGASIGKEDADAALCHALLLRREFGGRLVIDAFGFAEVADQVVDEFAAIVGANTSDRLAGLLFEAEGCVFDERWFCVLLVLEEGGFSLV